MGTLILNYPALNRSRVGAPWSYEEERELISLATRGESLECICNVLKRNEGGIIARAQRLVNENVLHDRVYERLESEFKIGSDFTYEYTKDNKMKGKTWTMVSLLQEDITTVKVKFMRGNDKYYTYKTRLHLEVDDLVVVPASHWFQIAQVVEVHDEPQFDIDSGIQYKWVVQKVNMEYYEKLVEKDHQTYNLLVNAEKHVERKKLIEAYTESLGLEDRDELKRLLSGE